MEPTGDVYCIDWAVMAAWAGAAGTVFVGIIAVFQRQIIRCWYRPDLQIRVSLDASACHKTRWGGVRQQYMSDGSPVATTDCHHGSLTAAAAGDISRGPVAESPTETFYLRLWVRNSGNVAAFDVNVFVARVFKQERGVWSERKRFLPMNLVWSHVLKSSVEVICPGLGRHVDFAHIDHPGINACKAVVDTEVQPNNDASVLEDGDYLFELRIGHREGSVQRQWVKLCVPQKWIEDETRMLTEGIKLEAVDDRDAEKWIATKPSN